MFQDISWKEIANLQQKGEHTLIDVRSPSEYAEATIPGSINIPLFDDNERAEIGTLYKQESPEAAKQRGVEVVSAKLPAFINAFQAIDNDKTVFCWRGGMRSKTAATVVDLMGIKVNRLQGGIRSYRQWVVNTLESFELAPQAIVLNGYTGAGKTIILEELDKDGYAVLDFEKMANHRGSIFGQIGLEPNKQKKFESLLLHQLLKVQQAPFVVMEAESKRIGKAILPEFIVEKKEHGTHLFIDIPIEERVKNILDDYQPWEHHEEALEAFKRIKRRIHTPVAAEIESSLRNAEYGQATRLLLEYYYDPLYSYSANKHDNHTIHATSTEEAVPLVKEFLAKQEVYQH
ncbi:tRNA 2-selenouridine(34) synthase MnmH [Sediminibacillus halophilus]|uniref:tRNA 2-selenouridine synthase n=1 Tax=Sediminibacillus halophilus TaxID=482461 RepID=A0A1G9X633_9BACI|nr:tRNA 2-selenouridine(34) synthase MnmH [Sediminibacillus halophilus]SDM92208.1 tRNA 2-selenouridine synthase [Sediminibacillus halophilus]